MYNYEFDERENNRAPANEINFIIPYKPPKKKRNALKGIAASVICMALVLAGGFTGAMIMEHQLTNPPDSNPVSENYESEFPFGDIGISVTGLSTDNTSEDGNITASPLTIENTVEKTLSLTELFVAANPAVVAISTETTGRNAFGQVVTLPAAGSGFIISEDGYIVTNNHVIENATSISVLMFDGAKYSAIMVGRDPMSDLAVLKIDVSGLTYLDFGNSVELLVGEQVAVIGNPLGEFANSMTVGYVSALDREINIDGSPRGMLQTDAAVNSGNSGGPLLNMKGQVIGVVTAKSGGSNVEGLGFAIPSSKAESVITQLIAIGKAEGFGYVKQQAIIGITVGNVEENGKTNVSVESIRSGSAAEKAGIKPGDIIVSVNGKAITSVSQLLVSLNEMFPGDTLSLTIRRDGAEIVLSITLDAFSQPNNENQQQPEGQTPSIPNDGSDIPFDPWGIFPDLERFFPQERM